MNNNILSFTCATGIKCKLKNAVNEYNNTLKRDNILWSKRLPWSIEW